MSEPRKTNPTARLLTGGPTFSVRLRDDITVERLGGGRISMSKNGRRFPDMPVTPLMEALIGDWVTEASIDLLAESAANPPAVYLMCAKLFSLHLLQAQCTVGGQPLFSILPAPDYHAWRESAPELPWRLSPHAYLRRAGPHFVLEMPLSLKKCIIHDERCLVWLMEMAREGTPAPFEDAARTAFYRALALMGALERDKPHQTAWEFHDLLFFHHSSIGFHDDPVGATWRLKGELPPAPLLKPCTGEYVSLPEPDGRTMELLSAPLAGVLARRRSGRIPGDHPITIEELGALLHVSARIQRIGDDPAHPCPVSFRASPSAGALHSIEIYLLVRLCAGLAPGVWRYDPARHGLESVAAKVALLDAYIKDNPHAMIEGAGLPHLRVVMTSRILRVSWKYEKIAYRLVLQDLGCLYQTLSLAATALGLASCILGAVDARRLGAIMRLEPLAEPVIGEMTLSSQ
jgi:SagB-type dehydrogenase family enzyme